MDRLKTVFVDNLKDIDDGRLDEIAADGHTFANRRWFRMLDAAGLANIIGGKPALQYAVVKHNHLPIAVCPVLRVSGDGAYFVYSIQQFYFEHWLDEAVRMAPERREHFARLFKAVTAFRRVLEWSGSKLDDCLIVCNPLSYRGEVAIAPQTGVPREELMAHLVGQLKRHARRKQLPLCFFGVEGESGRWADSLTKAGCTRSFLFHDNVIDLESFDSFDDYLHSFHRTTRRAFQRDIRRTAEAGIEFRFVADWSGMEDRLAHLYRQTYGKYGSSYFRQPPEFWRLAARQFGDSAEMIVAERAGEVVGFSLLLHNDRRGETWTYRIGRSEADGLADVPYYFGLSFYGPIRRAIERGYRRIWLGPASYETKAVRGAQMVPLYNYFWSPRRLDRLLLLPYLKGFGEESRRQIESSRQPIAAKESKPAQSLAIVPKRSV